MNLDGVWCTIDLACLLAVGWGTCIPFLRHRSRLEVVGFILCLGPGIAALILIAVSMLGWRPSRAIIVTMAIVSIAIGIAALSFRSVDENSELPSLPPSTSNKIWKYFCLAAIGYGIFIVARDALFHPVIDGDAFQIWQLKGKVLAIHALFPKPAYFFDVTLSYSHLRYPILVPMLSAGLHTMTGHLDDELGKTPGLLMYLGLGAVVYAAIRDMNCPAAAIAATALLLTTPIILAFAASGSADIALTAFYGCSLISILRWRADQRLADLILAFLSSVCMAWTKNEGIALAAINALVILALTPHPLQPRNLKAAISFTLTLAILILPWIVYTHDLPATDENYNARLNLPTLQANLSRLPVIVRSMLSDTLDWHRWGLFWIALIAVQLFSWRRPPFGPIATLWILLLLHLCAYLPPYMVTTWDLTDLLRFSQSRLLLHATPAAALLIGLQLPICSRERTALPAKAA